jgi:hypothetical protein
MTSGDFSLIDITWSLRGSYSSAYAEATFLSISLSAREEA